MPRRAGIKNKNKDRLLRQIQEEFPEYNPLMELIRIAKHRDTTIQEQIVCHKEVAQYVTPKLKAIEVSGDMVHDISGIKIELVESSPNAQGITDTKGITIDGSADAIDSPVSE